eukprot:2437846-Pleurochrysis_carterae.AAC.2
MLFKVERGQIRSSRQVTVRAGRETLIDLQCNKEVQSRSERGCKGWTHLRGGPSVVAQLDCVGHARYGIPELEKQSASALQVHMRRECKMGNCASGPKGAARCDGFQKSTRDEGKRLMIVSRAKQ